MRKKTAEFLYAKLLTFWKYSLIAIFLLIFGVSFVDGTLAWNIVRTFGNGESAIGFWLQHGSTFTSAVIIAIVISNYDTMSWFLLFNILDSARKRGESWLLKLLGKNYEDLEADSSWQGMAYRYIERLVVRFITVKGLIRKLISQFVPRPTGGNVSGLTPDQRLLLYLFLLPYGLLPGGIWSGIVYSISFQLNQIASFVIIALANSLKMIIFGWLAVKIGPWWVIMIVVFFSLPTIKHGIEKRLNRN